MIRWSPYVSFSCHNLVTHEVLLALCAFNVFCCVRFQGVSKMFGVLKCSVRVFCAFSVVFLSAFSVGLMFCVLFAFSMRLMSYVLCTFSIRLMSWVLIFVLYTFNVIFHAFSMRLVLYVLRAFSMRLLPHVP